MKKEERGKIDWLITIVPFMLIIRIVCHYTGAI